MRNWRESASKSQVRNGNVNMSDEQPSFSQSTASSVRDRLPDNCCLSLEDDDEDTLEKVLEVEQIYFTFHDQYDTDTFTGDEACENDSDPTEFPQLDTDVSDEPQDLYFNDVSQIEAPG